jgi:cysteine-S-conjugate beta-lyase
MPSVRHTPFASLDAQVADRTITLMAPSKSFNIPGLGCAFAVISNPKLRQSFKRAMEGIVPHVNVMGFVAAQAAYTKGWPWMAALLDYLRGNRDRVIEVVNQLPGLHMGPVEGTYLAWIDTRGSGIEDPVRFFENAGVGLSDGVAFGTPGFVRLEFCLSARIAHRSHGACTAGDGRPRKITIARAAASSTPMPAPGSFVSQGNRM